MKEQEQVDADTIQDGVKVAVIDVKVWQDQTGGWTAQAIGHGCICLRHAKSPGAAASKAVRSVAADRGHVAFAQKLNESDAATRIREFAQAVSASLAGDP